MWNRVFSICIEPTSAHALLHQRVASLKLVGEINFCRTTKGLHLPLLLTADSAEQAQNPLANRLKVLDQVRSTHVFHMRIGHRIGALPLNEPAGTQIIYSEALAIGTGLADLVEEIERLAESAQLPTERLLAYRIPIARWKPKPGFSAAVPEHPSLPSAVIPVRDITLALVDPEDWSSFSFHEHHGLQRDACGGNPDLSPRWAREPQPTAA